MSRSNIRLRRHLCHAATYLVIIELPTLYLPRATVGALDISIVRESAQVPERASEKVVN